MEILFRNSSTRICRFTHVRASYLLHISRKITNTLIKPASLPYAPICRPNTEYVQGLTSYFYILPRPPIVFNTVNVTETAQGESTGLLNIGTK